MNDDPWFRRFGAIGYVPINARGLTFLVAMGFAAILLFWLGAEMWNSNKTISMILYVLAVVVVIAGHGIVLWRMDDTHQS